MLSVYKLEGYIPLTAMSGGTAQPFCKWSRRVPIRIVEKNMGNDRLGWAGCWWVAGMGQGQLVAAQLPPSCSLRCSFNVLWPLSPRETGERVGKPKVRKTHGSRWRRFNKWMEKKKIPADAKAITHHLPPADWCPAILQAAAKHKKSLFYWGAWCIMVWNIPGQFGSAVPSQPLAYSQTTHGAAELETEKALALCKHCSATAKPALFWSQI